MSETYTLVRTFIDSTMSTQFGPLINLVIAVSIAGTIVTMLTNRGGGYVDDD